MWISNELVYCNPARDSHCNMYVRRLQQWYVSDEILIVLCIQTDFSRLYILSMVVFAGTADRVLSLSVYQII